VKHDLADKLLALREAWLDLPFKAKQHPDDTAYFARKRDEAITKPETMFRDGARIE